MATNIHSERLQAVMAVMLDDSIPLDERRRIGRAISEMSDEEIAALDDGAAGDGGGDELDAWELSDDEAPE